MRNFRIEFVVGVLCTIALILISAGNYLKPIEFSTSIVTADTENPQTSWITIYGEEGDEYAHSVSCTSDGEYIISGETKSFGADPEGNAFLARINASGNVSWIKTYGGSGEERGYFVTTTSDGGYIVTGWTNSFGAGGDDLYLIKTDALGEVIWNRTYGGDGDDWGESVVQTEDGGYIIAGKTSSFGAGERDFYLIKVNASGELMWNKTYGGSEVEWAFSVDLTNDNGYVIAGYTGSFGAGDHDFYVVKTDASGELIWNRTYGGTGYDRSICVSQTSDDGYIVVGYTTSFGTEGEDVYLVKTDASGELIWNRTYGGVDNDRGYFVVQTEDDGYIVAGWTESFGAGSRDAYLIKTDTLGNPLWNKTYGGANLDRFYSVAQDKNGEYVAVGGTYSFGSGMSDIYIVKVGDTTTSTTTSTTTIPEECELKGDSSPCDGTVSDFELLDYIDKWVQGLVGDFDLLEAINNWAGTSTTTSTTTTSTSTTSTTITTYGCTGLGNYDCQEFVLDDCNPLDGTGFPCYWKLIMPIEGPEIKTAAYLYFSGGQNICDDEIDNNNDMMMSAVDNGFAVAVCAETTMTDDPNVTLRLTAAQESVRALALVQDIREHIEPNHWNGNALLFAGASKGGQTIMTAFLAGESFNWETKEYGTGSSYLQKYPELFSGTTLTGVCIFDGPPDWANLTKNDGEDILNPENPNLLTDRCARTHYYFTRRMNWPYGAEHHNESDPYCELNPERSISWSYDNSVITSPDSAYYMDCSRYNFNDGEDDRSIRYRIYSATAENYVEADDGTIISDPNVQCDTEVGDRTPDGQQRDYAHGVNICRHISASINTDPNHGHSSMLWPKEKAGGQDELAGYAFDNCLRWFGGIGEIIEEDSGGVGAWGFNEDQESTIAVDLAGDQGNHGYLVGAQREQNGKYGSAIEFNRTNDYIYVSDDNELDLTNQGTVDIWIKTNSSQGTVISKSSSTGDDCDSGIFNNYAIQLMEGRVRCIVGDGEKSAAIETSTLLNDSKWHHLACTWNSGVGEMRIYVDGGEQQDRRTKLTFSPPGNEGTLRFGSCSGLVGKSFIGLLDNVMIWNTERVDRDNYPDGEDHAYMIAADM